MRSWICEVLKLLGPRVCLPQLQDLFPDVPRRVLGQMRKRFRRVLRRRGRVLGWKLHWRRPRSVWAIDGLVPPHPIAGGLAKILVVRDIASGRPLAAYAVPAEAGEPTRDLLVALFDRFGPPLALKCDNGSGFKADRVRELCTSRRVLMLFSPPRSPWYNGHIETGMSVLRDTIHEEAARAGRPGHWTQADIDRAVIRLTHEQVISPLRQTPAQIWNDAPHILESEREALYGRYHAMLARREDTDAASERAVIEDVLIDGGLLECTRVSIPRRPTKNRTAVRHVADRLAQVACMLELPVGELSALLNESHEKATCPAA